MREAFKVSSKKVKIVESVGNGSRGHVFLGKWKDVNVALKACAKVRPVIGFQELPCLL